MSARSRINARQRQPSGLASVPRQPPAAQPVSNPTPDTAPTRTPHAPANEPTVIRRDPVADALNEASGGSFVPPSAFIPPTVTPQNFSDAPESDAGPLGFKMGYGTVLLIPLALLALFAAWKFSK